MSAPPIGNDQRDAQHQRKAGQQQNIQGMRAVVCAIVTTSATMATPNARC
jgi:hypothetical protein